MVLPNWVHDWGALIAIGLFFLFLIYKNRKHNKAKKKKPTLLEQQEEARLMWKNGYDKYMELEKKIKGE